MNCILIPGPSGPSHLEGTRFVVVGANGTGKSRLGAWLDEQGGCGRPTHRISAQRVLQMEEFTTPLPRERADRMLLYGTDLFEASAKHKRGSRWHDEPVTRPLNDFQPLLASLFAHEAERNAKYYSDAQSRSDKPPPVESRIDKIRRIWHALLPHRTISFEDGKVEATMPFRTGTLSYLGRKMSDGERVALYLLGQSLSAPKDGLLIVDEPEIHLHPSIRDSLWNAIEAERPDCILVYITHDLLFAASRTSAKKLWLKSFDGTNPRAPQWEWEHCPDDVPLPEELVLTLLGSRRPVLFVESDRPDNLDVILYSRLFPERCVLGVGNCTAVDKCVTALRNLPALHHLDAHGIVDRDRRSEAEIAGLASRGVTCTPYAEIENLLLDERLLRAVAKRAGRPDATQYIDTVTTSVVAKLRAERDEQVAERGEAVLRYRVCGFSCKEIDAQKVSAALNLHVKSLNVASIYAHAGSEIDEAVNAGVLARVLQVYNQKGLTAIASSALGMKQSAFVTMAIDVILEDKSVRTHLRELHSLPSPTS